MSRTALIMTIVASAGCSRGDSYAVNEPTAYTYDAGAEAHISLPQPDVLEVALAEALDLVRRVDPELVARGFAAAAESFDESCPELVIHNGQDLWLGDCATQDGTSFRGNYLSLHWYDRSFEGDHHRRFLWNSGQANITRPDGSTFLAMGDAWLDDFDDANGDARVSTFLHGDFSWDADEVSETWIDGLYYVFMDVEATTTPSGDREIWLNGDLARLPGRLNALTLLEIELRRGPGACEIEPAGAMRFTDSQTGLSFQLDFDGADEYGDATSSCDGCGQLSTLDGDPLGALCVDMDSWLSWQDWPW